MSKELNPNHAPVEGDGLQLATNFQPAAPPDPVLQLKRYLTFLTRKWWIVLISVLSFGALAAAYVIFWPETYASSAHIWAAGKMGLQLREGTTYAEDNLTYAGTQGQLLESSAILGRAYTRVTNALHLNFPLDSKGHAKLPTIKTTQLPKSAVLELVAKGSSPELTVAFLNAVMDEFIAYKRDIRSATSGDTYTSVSEQIKKQEAELASEQEKLAAYMRDNNVAVLEERAKAASTYLTQLLAESSELKIQLELIESLIARGPSDASAGTNAIGLNVKVGDPFQHNTSLQPDGAPSPDFLAAQQELEKVRILRARLSQYLRPEHPKIVKLDEQIIQAQKLVEFFRQQGFIQLDNARQTVKTKLDRLSESIKDWEAKVNDASQRIAGCEQLKLNVTGLQDLHDHLLGLLQTVDVSKNLDQENITILDQASDPLSAKHTLVIVLFLIFAGFGTGLALVFVLQKLDDRVHSLGELTERFDEWIVGQVPEIADKKSPKQLTVGDVVSSGSELILADNDPRHMYVESYRNLRSALLFLPVNGERLKVLLITSAIPSEGKSTVAANLARTIAHGGAKVLLVDADLRRGKLHKLLGFQNEVGLGDLLHQPAGVAKYQQSNSHPNLTFLSRGKDHSDPGNLFLSLKLDALLQQWRNDFDHVIIDTCPVFAADDTVTLAPKVDGTLLIVRSGYSRINLLNEALNQLAQRQARVVGIIYNRANVAGKSYHYYNYAEYGGAGQTGS